MLRARFGLSADPEEFDFFESGGSSLDAVTLAREISDAVGRPLDPATLYYSPTFDELVAAAGADSGDDRAAGWRSAGDIDIDIDPGAAGARSAHGRAGVVERLLGRVLAVWTDSWGTGSGDPGAGAAGPPPSVRDGVAGLVATAGDAGRISLEGEWLPGTTVVRLSVRGDRATTAAEALGVVERAAAAAGLSRVVRSAFGEVFSA